MASAIREAEAWVSDRGGDGKVEAAVREADFSERAKTGRVRDGRRRVESGGRAGPLPFSCIGMKTDRIRTDITYIIFVFIFLFEFGFGHG